MRKLLLSLTTLLFLSCNSSSIDNTEDIDQTAQAVTTYTYTVNKHTAIGGEFQGFGGQLWEYLYSSNYVAQSRVDPADYTMRNAVIDLAPGHVRIFVPNKAATDPTSAEGADSKQSLRMAIDTAKAAGASVNLTWPGGYTGTPGVNDPDFARVQMDAFARLIHEFIYVYGLTNIKYVTIQNEGNTQINNGKTCPGQATPTIICQNDMKTAYQHLDNSMRVLSPPLRGSGATHPIQYIGGDLVYGQADQDNYYKHWMTWMHNNMSTLLDGWSIHTYWLYWNHWSTNDSPGSGSGVQMLKDAMAHRNALGGKPMYIMESGVRGYQDQVTGQYPGFYESGCTEGQAGCTPIEDTIVSSTHQGYFDLVALALGYRAVTKWEITYRRGPLSDPDAALKLWGMLGTSWNNWPKKPSYHLRDMWNAAVPVGWHAISVATSASAPNTQVRGVASSTENTISILMMNDSSTAKDIKLTGLAANQTFKLWSWNNPGYSGKVCYRPSRTSLADGSLTVSLHANNALVVTGRTENQGFPPCP